jgi:hypothetical protein
MPSILEQLKAGANNFKLVNYPGTDQKIAIKILSQREMQESLFAAERLFKNEKIEINMLTAPAYQAEQATQILYRALRNPEKLDEALAPNITAFRQLLVKNEKDILVEEYEAFEKECDPKPNNMTEEEFDKLFQDLKKNAETTLSNIIDIHTLKKLMLSMVKDLQLSQTDKS